MNNAPGIVAAISTAGIDKSMPPMIKINVIPKHNIPTVVSCSKTLIILFRLKNLVLLQKV